MARKLLLELSADIISAYVANNKVDEADLGSIVALVCRSLSELDKPVATPASVSQHHSSKSHEHLVCLKCGSRKKTLKRHLRVAHQLTPREYREEFNLPIDYSLTARSYSLKRSRLAHAAKLGHKSAKVAATNPNQAAADPALVEPNPTSDASEAKTQVKPAASRKKLSIRFQ